MVQIRHSSLGIFIIIIIFMDLPRAGNIKYNIQRRNRERERETCLIIHHNKQQRKHVGHNFYSLRTQYSKTQHFGKTRAFITPL